MKYLKRDAKNYNFFSTKFSDYSTKKNQLENVWDIAYNFSIIYYLLLLGFENS